MIFWAHSRRGYAGSGGIFHLDAAVWWIFAVTANVLSRSELGTWFVMNEMWGMNATACDCGSQV